MTEDEHGLLPRAQRRRDAAAAARQTPNYSPAVPRYHLLTEEIRQDLYEQIVRHRPRRMSFRDYLEALLEAAITLIDYAEPEPLVKLATRLPPGIAEAAERLQRLKVGMSDGSR